MMPYENRKNVLETTPNIYSVDIQSETFTKKDAIKKYKPDAIFVGDDWYGKFTGEGLGVPVIYFPYTKGISSTKIRKKIWNQ